VPPHQIAHRVTPARRAHHFPAADLQHRVERLLSDDLPSTRVFLLERLQPLRLVLLQRAVLDPPAIERLITDPQPLTRLRDRQSLGLELLRLSQLGDD